MARPGTHSEPDHFSTHATFAGLSHHPAVLRVWIPSPPVGEESHTAGQGPPFEPRAPPHSADELPLVMNTRVQSGEDMKQRRESSCSQMPESRAEGSSRSSQVWASSHPFLLPVLQ